MKAYVLKFDGYKGFGSVMTHGMNYTGTIVQLGLAGTTANLVYTSIATYTYIKNETELPGYGFILLKSGMM